MLEIIVIGSGSLLIIGASLYAWYRSKNAAKLDRSYHDALHAESVGDYNLAIQLYQTILDQATSFLLRDSRIQTQIQERIDTIRHQQQYLSQWEATQTPPAHSPVSGSTVS